MSYYDNVYLAPPEPDPLDELVNEKAEDLEFLIQQDWISDCIDWDKVYEKLYNQFEKEIEEKKAEAEISAWEERQNRWD